MKNILQLLLLTYAAILTNPSLAETTEHTVNLVVSPKQCTALKQGDTCYLDLDVVWNMPSTSDYCLYADQQKLKCWHNVDQGTWQQALTITDNMEIRLTSLHQQTLHTHTIRYAWVHKKNNSKAMRWRMF
ncbi:DUF3019 domain-containing protein [Pseudoalteromonas xiamenensis]|uniref:DUF3019 domain-containing protein n=1 Tax=Pseudoalteromonas xiamenensis TaxID=882626 RepID=A0A975HLT7_9GAMM|nr:DUF3019 domain-containing protein [Pseudoalteromonas xiamenensis]QTH72267.1 DUF3019 domain-containing protein [Pseudoalteromonas xiamenensis]